MAVVNNTVVCLKDFPIKFGETAIPFPTNWQQTPNKVQSLLQSEGGTDLIQSVRKDKMHIDAQFILADDTWVKFFSQYDKLDSFVLSQYSPITSAYEQRTVRMEGFSYTLRRKSQELTTVTGVWSVSFSLEEF